MAVVVRMDWPEVTPEQYQQAREQVDWERDVPKGAIFHVAFSDDDGFKVVDVWESASDFEAFVESRLRPVVEKLGIEADPKVDIQPALATFNPAALVKA